MRKQRIPPRKKYALWLAYGRACYYCREPLDFKDVWIDHILPERLLKTPEELKKVLQECELDSDFDIRDYCNWIPVHWRCNLAKGSSIFDKGATRYYVNIARERAVTAQVEEQRIIGDLKKDKLLASLEIALTEGLLSRQSVLAILKQETLATPRVKPRAEPIIVTFGLNYYDLWESEWHPSWLHEHEPSDYPHVCDLLERDLVKQLKSLFACEFFYPEASARNGETLSVRLAFVHLDEREMGVFKSDWWEVLEVASYSEIYGEFTE